MIRTTIGKDYEGVWAVKMTKGARDPRLVPDDEISAFHYNSKWTKDLRINSIETFAPATVTAYSPAGSAAATYDLATYTQFSMNVTVVRHGYFDGLDYDLPVFEVKIRRAVDGHFVEQYRTRYQSGEDNGGREAAFYRTTVFGLWFENRLVWDPFHPPSNAFFGSPIGNCLVPSIPAGHEADVIVWNLPADDTDILDAEPQVPVPGQRVIEITDYCRVAKPGYDVRTASPTQLAIDGTRRPASVLKGGDIALPIGVTEFEIGFPVTGTMDCDMILYEGQIVFPMADYGSSLIVEYWFSGTKLYISNTMRACRARFLVMAFDGSPPTAGPNDVFRQTVEGGIEVAQILRPGAADPPNFADIMLDSRWPCLQILAEGYLPIASRANMVPPGSINAGQSQTVTFNADGMFPFVKFMTVSEDARYGNGKYTRPAATFVTENYNNATQYHQGGSAFCVLDDDQATFWTFRGNPELEFWTSGGGWQFQYPDPLIGLRYYILGIPQP